MHTLSFDELNMKRKVNVNVENNICNNVYLHSGAVLYKILLYSFMEFLSFGIYFSLLVILYRYIYII